MGIQAELLARALQRLTAVLVEARGQKSRRQFDLASRTLGNAWKDVFGLDRRFLQMMQPAQAAAVVGEAPRQRGLVELLAEEADLLRMAGDADSAAATAKWAMGIVDAARLQGYDSEMRGLLVRLRTMAAHG